jgi:16S rRNA (guanine966-N2)-methyltransferase
VRIVAGTARGRRIEAPRGIDTRPTTDRVREALFNALASMDAIENAAMIDLFAGTGALGLEALSRGARHVTFVERDRPTMEVVRRNVEALGFGDRADLVIADALEHLTRAEAVDVLLCDPPYTFDRWTELLASAPASLVVIESDREVPPPPGWEMTRQKRYGTTVVTILSSQPSETPTDPSE